MTDTNHAAILRQHADTRRRGHSVNPDVLRAAADEIERLRDMAKVADIHIAVATEIDHRADCRTGKDLSQLASVEVVSHFRMTPEFLEDLHRIGKQYEELGLRIADSLRTAVEQRGGTDIRSIATHRPWRMP